MLILIVIASIALFYLLAVICDEYFVPSIDIISKKLKLSSDASGATLLAMGSSAPEFFAATIAIFGLTKAGADVGSGTIVGSAIFNVLVITGASAMFKVVKLQWKPVIRDLGFYVVTIVLLGLFFMDGKIVLYEAAVFLPMYAIYVYAVINWRKWFKYEDFVVDESAEVIQKEIGPSDKIKRAMDYLIPNVEKKPQLYVLSFILSIVVIGIFSYFLVELLVIAADILNVNEVLLALTVLAVGTSVPDLVSSIIVAKQGRGDMAVSNAIGSNIFNILFALGFPWTIYMIFNGGSIPVSNDNLGASIILLFSTVVAITFLLIIRNWRIGHKSGIILILLYIAYVIFEVVRA